ncbi:hypothetical protein Goshw_001825 [Gossypium schwendimanii]|uniref:Uncharacterized protein n=1 Tax=Gossypium schwendimanii TaxID=34291 RepID=A0A7J9M9C9_GOSSC|nr:hypothetical protein [Gossypium schwendimanii]
MSTLCGEKIFFIIFLSASKPYSFGHPSVESVNKRFLNISQPLNETTDAPIEAYHTGALRTRRMLVEFINLISATKDKRIVVISSMHAPMSEDVASAFRPRYGPSQQ